MGTAELPFNTPVQQMPDQEKAHFLGHWGIIDKFNSADVKKVAETLKSTPQIIAPELEHSEKAKLIKLLLEYADVLVTTVEELNPPADTPPLVLRTTGGPIK